MFTSFVLMAVKKGPFARGGCRHPTARWTTARTLEGRRLERPRGEQKRTNGEGTGTKRDED